MMEMFLILLVGQSLLLIGKNEFTLGELAKHREKTVDNVIQDFIDEYLTRLSFNRSLTLADTI